MQQKRSEATRLSWCTVGKRGRDFMVRSGVPVMAEFTGLTDKPTILDMAPIVRS